MRLQVFLPPGRLDRIPLSSRTVRLLLDLVASISRGPLCNTEPDNKQQIQMSSGFLQNQRCDVETKICQLSVFVLGCLMMNSFVCLCVLLVFTVGAVHSRVQYRGSLKVIGCFLFDMNPLKCDQICSKEEDPVSISPNHIFYF